MNNLDGIKICKLFEEVDEGILIYELEEETMRSRLMFINGTARSMLGSRAESPLVQEDLANLLGLTNAELKKFVNEKANRIHLSEKRLVNLFDGTRAQYLLAYNVLTVEQGYQLQITISPIKEDSLTENLTAVTNHIEDFDFDEGYIILMQMGNFNIIRKLYGKNANREIIKRIIITMGELLENCYDFYQEEGSIILYYSEKKDAVTDGFNRVIDATQKSVFEEGIDVLLDFRIGISSWTSDRYAALREAKYSLEGIKDSEESVISYIEPRDRSFMDFLIKCDLPYAIDKKELSVVFQAIYDLSNNELYGFEVLLRWHHTKYGNISPVEFIPLAEKSELITTLDLWVLKEALRQFDALSMHNKQQLKLNFNISPRDFFCDSFESTFLETIKRSGLLYSNVILELTETLNLSPRKSIIERIKAQGVMIALDDFGTGFASLSQIKKYDIDILKIDSSFVRDINRDYDNTQIISAILSMADNLNISVIAEGVEKEEQLNFLANRKCRFIQGYKYHKPMKIKDVESLIKKNYFANSGIYEKDEVLSRKAYVET